ncbi:Protein YecM [Vibrio stylophorae]|uniref:Protein YecM n=1 Tax=Vibrio stylophorae TaxID=659351 RepID=A0ABN8DR08_9VIBR|nr:VOC family protein [Vibrio stylophorae]CAH0533180.1 Protein YecM [Vibrio stylophorae]
MSQPSLIAQLTDSLPTFATRLQALSRLLGLPLATMQPDHIALRVNDNALAQSLLTHWQDCSDVLSDQIINGRPIYVLAMREPVTFGPWSTDVVELPFVGGKTYPEEGWEHVEFVIESGAQTPEQLLADLQMHFTAFYENWPLLKALGVKVKLSSPSGEGERLANPTVAFSYQGVCIKLHPHALRDVIASEQAEA